MNAVLKDYPAEVTESQASVQLHVRNGISWNFYIKHTGNTVHSERLES